LPHPETFEVLRALLVTLCIPLYVRTPLNENVISFAVLKDQADLLGVLDKEFERTVPEDLAINSKKKQEISDMIKKFYFADQHVSQATLLQFVNVSMCKQLGFKFGIYCLSFLFLFTNCRD
jgi:hypothetical protein